MLDSNGDSTTGTISVDITPDNDGDVWASGGSIATHPNTDGSVGVSFGDADGDPVTVTDVGSASNGTVAFDGGSTFTYTPNADFFGSDSFTYAVADQYGDSATATISVSVQDDDGDVWATGGEIAVDATFSGTLAVSMGDSDGEPVTVASFTQGAGGSVTFDSGTNTFTYTARVGFAGTDGFTYLATDPYGDSVTTTVTATVPSGLIGGKVWYDSNVDGQQQAGEADLAYIPVFLFQDGSKLAETTTGTDGGYQFGDLPSGSYDIRFDIPADENTITDAAGGWIRGIFLTPGEQFTSTDAGAATPGLAMTAGMRIRGGRASDSGADQSPPRDRLEHAGLGHGRRRNRTGGPGQRQKIYRWPGGGGHNQRFFLRPR